MLIQFNCRTVTNNYTLLKKFLDFLSISFFPLISFPGLKSTYLMCLLPQIKLSNQEKNLLETTKILLAMLVCINYHKIYH